MVVSTRVHDQHWSEQHLLRAGSCFGCPRGDCKTQVDPTGNTDMFMLRDNSGLMGSNTYPEKLLFLGMPTTQACASKAWTDSDDDNDDDYDYYKYCYCYYYYH